MAVAVLAALSCGCASKEVKPLADRTDFQSQVLQSDKPVLVDFYKGGGCPTCVMLHPILNQLADEYRGQVTFASFEAMTPFFQVTSPPLRDRYDIKYFPTAVLFVKGEERQRWIIDYNIESYRKALDEAVGHQVAVPTPAVTPIGLAVAAPDPGEPMVLARPLTEVERASRLPAATAAGPSAPANPAIRAVRPTITSKPVLDGPSDETEYILPLAKVRSRPDDLSPSTPPVSPESQGRRNGA